MVEMMPIERVLEHLLESERLGLDQTNAEDQAVDFALDISEDSEVAVFIWWEAVQLYRERTNKQHDD